MTVVKKTLAIHPVMDKYIRMTWAILVEAGYDTTYSSALNYMLLIGIMQSKDGLTKETVETAQTFLNDPDAIAALDLEDRLSQLRKIYKIVKRK